MNLTEILLILCYISFGSFFFGSFYFSVRGQDQWWIRPGFIFGSVFVYIYFLNPVISLMSNSFYFGSTYSVNSMVAGLVLFCVFGIIFLGSYLLSRGKNSKYDRIEFDAMVILPKKTKILTILLFGMLSLFTLAWLLEQIRDIGYSGFAANRIILTAGRGYLLAPILLLPNIAYIFSAETALTKSREEKSPFVSLSIVLLFLFISSLAGFLVASRTRILLPILLSFLIYVIVFKKGQLSPAELIRMLLVILLVLGIGIVLGVLRQNTMAGVEISLRGFSIREMMRGLSAFFGVSEHTFWWVDNPLRVKLQYGKSLYAALVGWIPRTLWADKPLGGGPIFLNIKFLNAYSLLSGQNLSSVTTGLVLEGLMNFGIAGVGILAFVYGLAAGVLERSMGRIKNSLHLVLWVLILFNLATYLYEEFFGASTEIAVSIIPIITLILLNKFKPASSNTVEIHKCTPEGHYS